ncbi:MAG: Palmitoyl protein thioesterase [Patescibacteria group bacterium]|nr:Palmitoyl protein thioesterase [Patescibacteria group bacterium]
MGSIPIFGTLWIRSEIGYRASLSRRRLPVRVRSGPQEKPSGVAFFIVYCIIREMVLIVLFPGWSGNSSKQNFSLLKERLEEIPGVEVETIDYIGIGGPFTKLRTRKSINELANEAEKSLLQLSSSEEKIIAIGHSLGAIIIRLLVERGHKFDECVFAGGPHKGFKNKYLWQYPLATLLGIKPFFELIPGSDFLKSLREVPPGIYVGSKIDEKVSSESAIPEEANRKIYLCCCGHNMFPYKKEEEARSAIPVVVEIIEKYVNKSQ